MVVVGKSNGQQRITCAANALFDCRFTTIRRRFGSAASYFALPAPLTIRRRADIDMCTGCTCLRHAGPIIFSCAVVAVTCGVSVMKEDAIDVS
jgi:hypothetical protein